MNIAPEQDLPPRLSLCMIVKNEAANLPRCLASARPYVDEIIVVDTGSSDETVAVAKQFGATVRYFDWCDDFAAARNVALTEATGDWILALDADEELVGDAAGLKDQLQRHSEVREYSLLLVDGYGDAPDRTETFVMRLFRNLPGVQYVGQFHEQVIYAQPTPVYQQKILAGVKINHYGYAPELKTRKMGDRNIPILESMRQRGQLSLMLLTSLADMHEMVGNQDQSQSCYSEAFERLLPCLLAGECPAETGYLRFLIYKLSWQVLEKEDYETARLLLHNGMKWFPTYPPLVYLAGLMLCYLGFYRGAIPYFQTCLQMHENHSYDQSEPFDRGYLTCHPAFSLGRCWMELQQWQEAAAAFRLALTFDPAYAPAQERLAEIAGFLSSNP